MFIIMEKQKSLELRRSDITIYTFRPAGAQYSLLTVFYKHSAPLGLRCDLPKPRRGERCIAA